MRGNAEVSFGSASAALVPAHRFAGRHPFAFGSGVFGGGIGVQPPPMVVTAPSFAFPPPASPPVAVAPAADLPPCREVTPSGVTIQRGTSCSRAER